MNTEGGVLNRVLYISYIALAIDPFREPATGPRFALTTDSSPGSSAPLGVAQEVASQSRPRCDGCPVA